MHISHCLNIHYAVSCMITSHEDECIMMISTVESTLSRPIGPWFACSVVYLILMLSLIRVAIRIPNTNKYDNIYIFFIYIIIII